MISFDIKKSLCAFLNANLNDFWWLGHEVAIYFDIYIRIRMFDHDYDMDFHLTMMLHSTTSPYGWPVIEIAYGEMIFSLHRGCMGVDSLGRVVGTSAWCITHVWHTQVNTSVGSMYIIFWFARYKKTYVYVYRFQNLYIV